MSNDCCGTLRCVAKSRETLDRILKILRYEDGEYCLYRCKDAYACDEPHEENGLWVRDFGIDGAWSCNPFFDYGDKPDEKLVVGYEKNADGTYDYERRIYGKAHFTDLTHLCEELDFGCEMFTTEPGCCFEEYAYCDRNGCEHYESAEYNLVYPKDADGEDDYEAEPEEEHGLSDFGDFADVAEIYDRS